MPTYVCRTPNGLLSETLKSELARSITTIHEEATGDPALFVQVIFSDFRSYDFYLGGEPLEAAHAFIQGHIREGLNAVVRGEIISKLLPTTSEILGVPRYAVWVYLSELPPRAMSEFGHILPKPGDEATWFESLPPEDRRRLELLKPSAS